LACSDAITPVTGFSLAIHMVSPQLNWAAMVWLGLVDKAGPCRRDGRD
jgi:hypothetical protein